MNAKRADFTFTPARTAASFLDSIGVNVHMGYPTSPYANAALVATRLQELGIRHVRNDLLIPIKPAEVANLHQLTAAGIKLDLIVLRPTENATKDQANLAAFVNTASTEFPNDTELVEGPNEYDLSGSGTWASALKTFQPQIYAAVRGNPALQSVPVLSPALGGNNAPKQLAGITGFDIGNVHAYPNADIPETAAIMTRVNQVKTYISGSAPIMLSEDGYNNAINAVATVTQKPASEAAVGHYLPRMLLDNFRNGIARTYVYELADVGVANSSDVRTDETALTRAVAHFGLLHFDLSYKPSASALRALTTILADSDGSFTPAGLSYTLTGAPADLHQVLLQKSDGSFYLALWRAESVWDPTQRIDLDPPASQVTLELPAAADLALFRPGAGSAATARVVASSYSLDVGADVQLVRIAPPTAPTAPLNVTATAADEGATVTWDAPSGGSPVDSYTVSAVPDGPSVDVPAVAGQSSYSTLLSGLPSGGQYSFRVTATNVAGSGPSGLSGDPIEIGPPPGAPSQVTATAGDASALVRWQAPTAGAPPTGYTVTAEPGDVTVDVPVDPAAPPTSATVGNLQNGTAYTFTVTANSDIGSSPPSLPTPPIIPGPPGAPTSVQATAGDSAATVSWTPPVGAPTTSYTVAAGPDGPSVSVGTTGSTREQATVSGLTNGTAYTFVVTAQNDVGTGPASDPSDPIVPGPAGQPQQVAAVPGDSQATVSWTPSGPPASSYRIVSKPAAALYTVTGQDGGPPPTSVVITKLTNNTVYTFTVTALNDVGSSAPSDPSNPAIPAVPPGPPTAVSAAAGNALAQVSWKAPTGTVATSYTVTAAPGGMQVTVNGSKLGAAAPTSTTFPGLTNGTAYTFTVTASNSVATSGPSAPSNAVTPNPSTSTTVQETSASIGYGGWSTVADPTANAGAYRVSATAGDRMVLGFSATAVSWVTRTGPNRGKASVLVDGKTLATVDLYSATAAATTRSFSGLANRAHTLTIAVLGTKNAASSAAGVVVDAFKVGSTVYDDAATAVSVSDWRNVSNSAASGGKLRMCRVANRTVSLSFMGSGVSWVSAKGPAYGKATLLVDGTARATVDLYASSPRWQQTVVTVTGLAAGPHTVTVKVLGTRNAASTAADVPVDAFVVRS